MPSENLRIKKRQMGQYRAPAAIHPDIHPIRDAHRIPCILPTDVFFKAISHTSIVLGCMQHPGQEGGEIYGKKPQDHKERP